MSARTRRCAILLVVLLGSSRAAWAQSSLPDLPLEELMKLDGGQVFGASERLQPVTEAPASVSFITAEEIARYGYRTLADILQGVRGMYVTNDRSFSFVGTRGFGKPGDYNSRILLLINGHRVNDNIFGQAEIGAEFGLDAAMFERVEIIRGPASSLYGDSAFFAVVNVITRSGASLSGAAITLETGTLGTRLLRASAGRRLANGLDVSRLYFPVFDAAATNHGVAEGLDGEGVRQFYGRMTFKGLDVTTAYGTRQRDIPTASSDTVFNEQVWREEVTDRHSLVDAQYGHWFRDTRLAIRASYDRFTTSGVYPFAVDADSTPLAVGIVTGLGSRWTVSSGVTKSFRGRQTTRAGLEFIDNVHQDQVGTYVGDPVPVLDLRRSSTQHAAYVQHEIKLGRYVIIDGGLRYDGYDRFSRVTPRAALIVLPSPSQSLKYLYGSAFRAPNEYELNAFYFGERVDGLRPEAINTHELVWERYFTDRLRTAVSTYWYKADRLITETIDPSTLLGASFVNEGEVRAKGLELEAQMRFKRESRALVSYAFQSAVDQQTHAGLPNSPRHVVKGRISVPGPTRGSFVSIEGRLLSSRTTLLGSRVGAAANVNLHVIQPLGPSWEIFGGLSNLFDNDYSDPASAQHRQDAIPQNGRTARIGLRWRAGKR
jgi:outer membrane receptor for ferrienterochelin and colicins